MQQSTLAIRTHFHSHHLHLFTTKSNRSEAMAKLVTALALVGVLLVIIANISFAQKISITTIEVDEKKPGEREEKCRQEIQQQDMGACAWYIMQSSPKKGEGLEMPGENNIQNCCNELKKVRDECQCMALKAVIGKLLEMGRVHKQEEYQKAMERAKTIPTSCRLKEQCRFRTFVF